MGRPRIGINAKDRLLAQSATVPEAGCWLWTGHTDRQGYGRICIAGAKMLAHRASWVIHIGAIPDGMDVLHRCDTPPCINPEHLFLGDDFTNQADAIAKGRSRHLCGEAHPRAKLTNDQVVAIRADARPRKDICESYGMSKSQIRKIITHKVRI